MQFWGDIDWHSMFIPNESILAMVIRGTLMYLGMFTLLRFFRRQAGSVSIADLLLIVIIADAAQNGMAGESKTVTEALILICVIIFWDYAIDWLGFRSVFLSRVLEPQPLLLVRNGRMIKTNMDKEMITEDEIYSQLRQHGIEDIDSVRQCCLESNGEFSFLLRGGKRNKGSKSSTGGVN